MSSSNCCFLTCIQVSQDAGQVAWCSHLFQNFPQFIVIHTVKGFGIVNKAEIDVFFWNSLAFSIIQRMLAIWSLVPLPFLKPAWTSGSSWFTYCWSLAWRILSITTNKASGGDGIPVELFQILEDDTVKCCPQYGSKFGKLSSGHRTGKGQFSFQSQRKAMPKNVQTTTQLHSSHTPVK